VIRPVHINDIFLIRRLGQQATTLNIIQALLQPRNAFWAMLTSAAPWNHARVMTYILDERHTTNYLGFIQSRKRADRPESDLLLLAPALDHPQGHPSIWEKLIDYQIQKAIEQQLIRIYIDVRDQPLPVKILSQAGFTRYNRQTIWRLSKIDLSTIPDIIDRDRFDAIRPLAAEDEWALRRLYAQVTPLPIQKAEGNQTGDGNKLSILAWGYPGIHHTFVLEKKNGLQGCIQIAYTDRGIWLQLWIDSYNPDTEPIHLLIQFALHYIQTTIPMQSSLERPIYIGVSTHQGGLNTILADYNFAPFIDRARMVRHILRRVHVTQPSLLPALEPVPSLSSSSYATLPDRVLPNTALDSKRSVS